MTTISLLIALCLPGGPAIDKTSITDMATFFRALSAVESGHNDRATGDRGRSIGRYQIQRAYWQDSRIPGRYEQCRDRTYAERVMTAYWRRYCPQALKNRDYETLARIHNGGGPRGHKIKATAAYWQKVKSKMN